MAKEEHIKVFRKGPGQWDAWRQENPSQIPDLSGCDFAKEIQRGLEDPQGEGGRASICMDHYDFSNAILRGASFVGIHALGLDMRGADLQGISLQGAELVETDIRGANLNTATFGEDHGNPTRFVKTRFDSKTGIGYLNILGAVNWNGDPLFESFVKEELWLQAWRTQSRSREVVYRVWRSCCDCGRGFFRWAWWCLFVVVIFGLIFAANSTSFIIPGGDGLHDGTWFLPFYCSGVVFSTLGFGDITPKPDALWMQVAVLLEVLLGYVMFGALITIFARKFVRRS